MNNDGESITLSRVHRMVCNSRDILDIKMVILQGGVDQKLVSIYSAEHNYFDPILDMDEVLEFVSPSHSEVERIDGPQE